MEVRTKEEILATLDERGRHEGLPFMPEMLRYCGRRFQVFRRAHKTCDPPHGLQARRMPNAVHLVDLRCDGAAHGGCESGCLVFWKDAWLKSGGESTPRGPAVSARPAPASPGPATRCTEADLFANIHADGAPTESDETVYVCQSTSISASTRPLPWWDLRQYVEDITSRNVRPSRVAVALLVFLYHSLAESGLGIGATMRRVYDVVQGVRGGTPYPLRRARVARPTGAPSSPLDLKPGELVRVRSYTEILQTLDRTSRNQGMYFDVEQIPFCDKTYRVLRRVERIIDEKTGRMLRLRNEAVILENVMCQARYAKCRRFCPRSIYSYWRPTWLHRVAATRS